MLYDDVIAVPNNRKKLQLRERGDGCDYIYEMNSIFMNANEL